MGGRWKVETLKPDHADERRAIYDWATVPVIGAPIKRVSTVQIPKRGVVIGNHYHAAQDEVYLILRGRGRMALCTAAFPDEHRVYEVGPMMRIVIPSGIGHALCARTPMLLQIASTEPADPMGGDNLMFDLSSLLKQGHW